MKKISLLKIIFIIHLFAFASYFIYNFVIKKNAKEIQSHILHSPQNKNPHIENKPIGIDIGENTGTEVLDSIGTQDQKIEESNIDNLIKEHGTDYITPDEKLSILQLIIQENRNDLFIKYIDKFNNIDHQNKYGATALVMAASSGDFIYAQALLKRGANPNIKFNKRNFSILMDASMEGNLDMISTLIKHNANINDIDNTGKSALMYACIEGHLKVIQLLISNGANIKAKDHDNLSCFDYAVKNKHTHLYDLLK